MRQTLPDWPKTYHAISNIVSVVPLENHPKILLLSLYLNFSWFELNGKIFIFFFSIVCLFVCTVDHGVNEEEPVDEQYRKPEPEDPYREQNLPEGFEDGKFNLILWCMLLS